MEARNRIDPALKHRSGHDAHIVAIAQGKQVLLHDERANTAGVSLHLREQVTRRHVVLIDAVDDFGDDLVLEGVPAQSL